MKFNAFVRPLAAAIVAGALAMPPAAFAAPADTLQVTDYGTSGAWTLRRATTADGEVQLCDAFMLTGSERGLRFEYNRDSSLFAFSAFASAAQERAIEVEIWWDNNRAESTLVSMSLETDATGYEWRTYRTPNSEPDGLTDLFSNASTVNFAYMVQGEGEHIESFALKGTNAVVKKTIACVLDAPSATATAAAPTSSGPYVIHGTCKLVVDGRTYIDIKANCPIWMANDGTGGFWINTDRENYLGDYFAELAPAGDGTASGNWNGERNATHAQSFLGEDFRQKKGGCWANARATICAAR
ncbi:hypothetical protein [Zavarzinia compransoris]|uniref:Uncharacterized protein n=1 Tax=Zavarzinia compransoris TaxID=1264899 RepID=A0A317E836_9PROT|nr:hypothetical protein [Zavarzinia compransoris]PWR23237.1 hypothetical protein DKG75_01295 [Zavarzinia compransoris]TDP46203.1 hypothetical protein DES42_104289 [Zavarzinia compransoris]